jgi:hypothetical protein
MIEETWMYAHELAWLFNRAKEMASIVEIGSWKGRSTEILLKGCKGKVYAVDHWRGSPAELGSGYMGQELARIDVFEEFLKRVGSFPNLSVLKMPSAEAAKQFDRGSVDMVFIDAGHDYASVMKDLEAWRSIPAKLLCGHDAGSGWPGVIRALKDSGIDFELTGVGTIWQSPSSTRQG